MTNSNNRCSWAQSELYVPYHDNEWGKPERDSIKLFENICLEGVQVGLSWLTILKRREAYRKAFFNFNPHKIAQMTESDIDLLMENAQLIRYRRKMEAIVKNAKAYVKMEQNGESLTDLVWSFVDNQPQINDVPDFSVVPVETEVSKALAKALKKRGFSFVGGVNMYAFMQSMGLVDDHHNDCYCKSRKEQNKS